ncbi:hypothetical protein [Rhodospira trueperi]|uniref:Uncharacterized protein n=1 Tax=Rhodospira trueperi TaxID=69960 RepID=A0A1G7E245_9PROT|nr:hypothetical protein [Rhodospira trueperi]SDE57757.1 hypothetical protein SAMN05421720_108137 [Rhodospira trueperi]
MAMPADTAPPTSDATRALADGLLAALDDGHGGCLPLGDPRQPEVIRAWAELTAEIGDDALDDTLSSAVAILGADRALKRRLLDAGLMPDVPVQTSLIAGFVRMFRRIKAITAAGGLDDAALMAETRRDMRALNQQMTEALGTIRDQRAAMGRMGRILTDRERRQARTSVELSRTQDELERIRSELIDTRTALAQTEAERDDAHHAMAALRAERDDLRRDLNRTRAGVEDLKAKYLEKFALALHDLNRARALLFNDPRSTLPAMKASVAQGYYMILEDMGAGADARKVMASIRTDGF